MVWPALPYELLGKATAVVLGVISLFAIGVLLYLLTVIIRYRLLTRLINLCWRGYDVTGEHPPRWRRKTAVYLHCIKYWDFSDLDTKLERLSDLEQRDAD